MADWYFRSGNPQNSLKVCPGCRSLVRKNEEFCPFCARRLRAAGGMRALIGRVFARSDSVTRLLIGLIAAVFVLQQFADFFLPLAYRDSGHGGLFSLLMGNSITYIRMGSNFHPLVAKYHEFWRLLTSCFLHFGLFHILFNCWAFWDLGRLAEKLWGGRQVFATFILTGIVGGAFSFGWNTLLNAPKNSAGASGAVCGVLGLLLGAYYRNRYHVGETLGPLLVRWAVYILAFGLAVGADNAAHIGGMLSGSLLGYLLPPTSHSKNPVREMRCWNAMAAASVLLLVVSFAFAIAFFARGPEFLITL